VCAAVIVLSLRCANECHLRCVARLKQALCAICAEHINNARQVWRWGRNAFAVLTVRAQVDINLRWRVAHGRRRHVTGAAAARDDVHASRVSERCVGNGAARDHLRTAVVDDACIRIPPSTPTACSCVDHC
jgi:hypothetical protein